MNTITHFCHFVNNKMLDKIQYFDIIYLWFFILNV
jgi:hypothetical protein